MEGLGALRGRRGGDVETKGGKRVARPWRSDSSERANPSHLTRRICRFRRNSFPPHPSCPSPTSSPSVRFNTAPSTYGFSLCLRRGPCAGRASQAREDAELRCSAFETLFQRGRPAPCTRTWCCSTCCCGRWESPDSFGPEGRPWSPTGTAGQSSRRAKKTHATTRPLVRYYARRRRGLVPCRKWWNDKKVLVVHGNAVKTSQYGFFFSPIFFLNRDNWVPIKDYMRLN